MFLPESSIEPIEMLHPVEKWHDQRFVADRRRERIHRGLEIVCLTTQQDGIEWPGQFTGKKSRWRLTGDIAMRTFDDKPLPSQQISSCRPNEKSDVSRCVQEAPAEVSSDGSRTDDQNPHVSLHIT
jgi:hypothetical protein